MKWYLVALLLIASPIVELTRYNIEYFDYAMKTHMVTIPEMNCPVWAVLVEVVLMGIAFIAGIAIIAWHWERRR